MMVRKLMALSLCLLLGSCSATQPMVAGPSGSQDLSRYVLVIENTADGKTTHAWKPAKDFDLTEYRNLASVRADEGRIVRVSLDAAECERQYDICVPECQASTRIHQVDKIHIRYQAIRSLADWEMELLQDCLHEAACQLPGRRGP